jgi:hypothetical protein
VTSFVRGSRKSCTLIHRLGALTANLTDGVVHVLWAVPCRDICLKLQSTGCCASDWS